MKISKKSWHYRLLAATETPADTVRAVYGKKLADWYDLPYRGRRTCMEYVPDSTNLCRYFWDVMLSLFCLPFGIGMFGVMLLMTPPFMLGVWFLQGAGWVWEQLPKRKPREDGKERRPGLLRSWLKAKKEKVCPLIEWED